MNNYNVIWNRDCDAIIESLRQQAKEECLSLKSKSKIAKYVWGVSLLLLIILLYFFRNTVDMTDTKTLWVFLPVCVCLGVCAWLPLFYQGWDNIVKAGGYNGTLEKIYNEEYARNFYENYKNEQILTFNTANRHKRLGIDDKSIIISITYEYEDITKTVKSDELIIDQVEVKTNITIPTIYATNAAVVLQLPYADKNQNDKEETKC